MRIEDFDVYKDLLMEKSGLVLTPDKSYLLDSRLTPVAKHWGFETLDKMSAALRGVAEPSLIKDIVEAMTTNETSFFRDTRPFDIFRETIIPSMIERRGAMKRVKMWCAAASSGQEPYSLSMIIKEHPKLAGWNFDILGTDISTDILDIAKAGVYSQFEVQRGMPIQMLMKYFEQKDEKWHLKDDIKKMVQYKYFNLLDSMTALGKFDIIFCRNVLIYFDKETKAKVLAKMKAQLAPDGYLFLGGAETVIGITDAFVPAPDLRGVYIPAEAKVALQQTA